jgi:GMP synthase-like glutamine amidotransferase
MTIEQHSVLVIRHESCSSLGLLESVIQQAAIPIKYLDTPAGETLPDAITNYSHLIVLGGAISAYEDQQYPFLRYEFDLIETAIDHEIPVLGICLGAQILATVLGAAVYRGTAGREVGWCELQLTPAGQRDRLLQDFPQTFRVFQSHQDTFDLPKGSVHLATSEMYAHQAFRYRDLVWALQFHLEINEKVLSDCASVIEQEIAESQIEATNLPMLLVEAKLHSPAVVPLANRLMHQFLFQTPALVQQ